MPISQTARPGEAGPRERIERAEALLAAHTLAGQATDREGVRRLVLAPYPYVLFYHANRDGVIVMRLRHAAGIRNPLEG